jgi:uncharacterized surface protein with fasciclin (FAS1) repeats
MKYKLKPIFVKTTLWSMAVGLVSILGSCTDLLSDYYNVPGWIGGSAYEILQDKGNYKLFLEAVDSTGYKEIVDGNSIVTIMAPNDDAFRAYMDSGNYTSIASIPKKELEKLVTYHILYYAFNTEKLNNFRPIEGDDCTEEEKLVNAGMYYKFRTRSRDDNSIEFDVDRNMNLAVYHFERYLPVFSKMYFQTKNIDPKRNYEYFFPETGWNAGKPFGVSNAALESDEIIGRNGYVYEISKVLNPLNTIYQELSSRTEFSDFKYLYDQYSMYTLDEGLTQEYGNGTKLYLHYHSSPMANIALEWPQTSYTKVTENSSVGYTIFAPTNDALNAFFNSYWKVGGYDSLKQVSKTSIQKILFNSVYSSALAFPDEVASGKLLNSYGAAIDLDVYNNDVVPTNYRLMCENGALYGCTKIAIPALFASITGPAYQYKKYSYYLQMLNCLGSKEKAFWSKEARYISLMPTNTQILNNGFYFNAVSQKICTDIGGMYPVSEDSYAYGHILDLGATPGEPQDFPVSGYGVFKTASPTYTFYVYTRKGNDGSTEITNSFKYNERIYPNKYRAYTDDNCFYKTSVLNYSGGEWSNGKSYQYNDGFFVCKPTDAKLQYQNFSSLLNVKGDTLPYSGFARLLEKAVLFANNNYKLGSIDKTFLMLVPTTSAIIDALNNRKIPGLKLTGAAYDPAKTLTSQLDFTVALTNGESPSLDSLQSYLKNYFMPLSTAGISNYPFIGWQENTSAGIPTLNERPVLVNGRVKILPSTVEIKDFGTSLKARLQENGNGYVDILPDFHYFPFIFTDGCIQFLEKCF